MSSCLPAPATRGSGDELLATASLPACLPARFSLPLPRCPPRLTPSVAPPPPFPSCPLPPIACLPAPYASPSPQAALGRCQRQMDDGRAGGWLPILTALPASPCCLTPPPSSKAQSNMNLKSSHSASLRPIPPCACISCDAFWCASHPVPGVPGMLCWHSRDAVHAAVGAWMHGCMDAWMHACAHAFMPTSSTSPSCRDAMVWFCGSGTMCHVAHDAAGAMST